MDRPINEYLKGMPCYGGLDLASKHDLASFVLDFPVEDAHFIKGWHFAPEATIEERTIDQGIPYREWRDKGDLIATPGEVIDYNEIFDTIKDTYEKYNIIEIGFDRWGATQITNDLSVLGIEVIPVGMGMKSMSPPTKELDKMVREGVLFHDGNEVMTWAMHNVVVQEDAAGNIKPHKKKSEDKIDPVVSLIIALNRALRNLHGSEETSTVYSSEGSGLTVL